MAAVTYDPAEQAQRRRRARISQTQLGARLQCAISRISEYETGKCPLPWLLTSEDYERALLELIAEAKQQQPRKNGTR